MLLEGGAPSIGYIGCGRRTKKSIHVPAFFANRAHLSRLVGSARLAFAEELDGELSYSVAVRMTDMEMTVLRDLLIRAYPLGEKLAE